MLCSFYQSQDFQCVCQVMSMMMLQRLQCAVYTNRRLCSRSLHERFLQNMIDLGWKSGIYRRLQNETHDEMGLAVKHMNVANVFKKTIRL